MILTIRPAQAGDVALIAPRLRQIDRLECKAYGKGPHEALRRSFDGAVEAWTGLLDGVPEAMFGLGVWSLLDGRGFPWFLGTDAVYTRRREMPTLAPAYLERMRLTCPRLENMVHQRNVQSIRWLKRLGFRVEPEARTLNGEPMLRFSIGD